MQNSEETLKSSYDEIAQAIRSEIYHCESALQRFGDAMARTYEGIAENLPKIITQIDAENEEARALIEYFISGDQADAKDNVKSSVVVEALEEARTKMVDVATRVHHMFSIDQKIFKQIKSQVDQIQELRNSINEITVISNDIELLSYNSVFVAGKAGASGAAFSYIANEIKVLSNHTKNLADKMRLSSDTLVENYEAFNREIERINQNTGERLNNVDIRLTETFDKYHLGLRNIAELIFQTLERADNAKKHIPAIMVSTQIQDLVRQLLEQTTRLNNDLDTSSSQKLALKDASDDSRRYVIDVETRTARNLASAVMIKDILETIFGKMRSGGTDLNDFLIRLKGELCDIETDRASMIDFFSQPQDALGGKSSIELIFDESVNVISDLFNFIKSSISHKREVGHYGAKLERNLKTIEAHFEEMRGIIKQFSIIKVVSKMEIARESRLSMNMTASSEMFERLTESIDKRVIILRSQLNTINQNIIANLNKLSSHLTEQERTLREIDSTINSSIISLQTIRYNINDAVKAVGQGSDKLFSLIDSTLGGNKVVRRIVDDSQGFLARYNLIISKLQRHRELGKKLKPDYYSADDSYHRFEDLIEISNQFSIYTDNNRTDVPSNVKEEGGDLVLF